MSRFLSIIRKRYILANQYHNNKDFLKLQNYKNDYMLQIADIDVYHTAEAKSSRSIMTLTEVL